MTDEYFATKTRNCTHCRFSAAAQQTGPDGRPIVGTYMYQCRFGPPSLFAMPTGAMSANITSGFPIVTEQTLCAQFDRAPKGP